MSTAIETKNVTGRRQLHFNSIDDILADVEQLASAKEIRNLGNWSPGQILYHLAAVMKTSLDGAPAMMPGLVRFFLRLLFKRRLLSQPMSAGFKLPQRAAAFLPPPTTWPDGLQFYREVIRRLQAEPQREPSVFLGKLTKEEWDQLHCRHAELHLSFLVPA